MKPKKRQNKKRIVFILSAILVGVIVVFLPFIVEKLYYTKAPLKFFEVSYEAKDFCPIMEVCLVLRVQQSWAF